MGRLVNRRAEKLRTELGCGRTRAKIQQRAGRELSTTQKYIRLAEVHGPGFGEVFPELPESLLKAEPPKSDPPVVGRRARSDPESAVTEELSREC